MNTVLSSFYCVSNQELIHNQNYFCNKLGYKSFHNVQVYRADVTVNKDKITHFLSDTCGVSLITIFCHVTTPNKSIFLTAPRHCSPDYAEQE